MYDLSDKELNYALFGLIYGDGHYSNGRIQITHSKQKFYVEWLEDFCKENSLDYKVAYDKDKRTPYGDCVIDYISIKVKQRRHFEKYGRIYNRDTGKREVSSYVLDRITPLGILFWYLDDGCLSVRETKGGSVDRRGLLSTQAFSLEDNLKIQTMFRERFGITTNVHKARGPKKQGSPLYYRQYLNAKNTRKLFDLFEDLLQFVPKGFDHKFNMKYIPNRMSESYAYTLKYNGLLGHECPTPN